MRKDIDLNLTVHPITGDLSTKKGSNAIKQSLRNIVMTNFYERGYNTNIGTNVRGSLFENTGITEIQTIKDNINQSIKNFEPNVEVVEVYVQKEDYELSVTIVYNEYNDPEEKSLSVGLERLR